MLGDGEIQEGQIWEAAMSGAFHKVDNVVAIVDYNGSSSMASSRTSWRCPAGG